MFGGASARFFESTELASRAFEAGSMGDVVLRMAREEGVLGGSSSGANMFAAVAVAKELGKGKRVLTIVPDSAERYLSKGLLD